MVELSGPYLRVSGVSKRYPSTGTADSARAGAGVEALRGVDLALPRGTFAALLGPSGCGKTTLLRIIAGFDRPDAGEVAIDSTIVDAGDDGSRRFVPAEQRRVGIVPQEGALFPHLSVAENVAFGLARAARRSGRVEELLSLVGLAGLGRRRPHELSGGQQQRVALARCLAPEPSIVLLDEPFAALDAGLRAEVRDQAVQILRGFGATTLLVTHDQEEALSMASLVALMRDGRIVQASSPNDLYDDPVDLWSARFVGQVNTLRGVVTGDRATCELGAVAVRTDHRERRDDTRAALMIRPEQLRLTAHDGANGTTGAVTRVAFHGHDCVVRVRLASGTELIARASGRVAVREGDAVAVTVVGDTIAYPDEPAS